MNGSSDDLGDMGGPDVDRQFADLQPAGVEQVADQLVQSVGFLIDGEERLGRLAPASRPRTGRADPTPSP